MQVGINHGLLLFRGVAQATDLISLHDGFIHRCHRLVNYDAYEFAVANNYARRFRRRLRFDSLLWKKRTAPDECREPF